MDPEFHLKKCRDCTYRVVDTDPNNLAFKGMGHCRFGPPSLIFITGMTPNGPAAQPVGSHYPPADADLGACSKFEPHEGNTRRNIVKTVTMPPADRPDAIRLS
jgi:hypothetical protein